MQSRSFFLTPCGIGLLSALASASHAQTLTDITLFNTNNTGAAQSDVWNTRGNDSIQNMYVRDSSGTFLNHGNAGGAKINLNLHTPGDYLLFFSADDSQSQTNPNRLGVNLFFNHQNAAPKISAFVHRNSLNFAADGASTVDMFGSSLAGANTLTFNTAANTVTLDAFYFTRGMNIFDSVSGFSNTGNGIHDLNGVMLLKVRPVPAPGALATALMGLLPGSLIVIRKRRTAVIRK